MKYGEAPKPGFGFLAYAFAACVWSLSNIRNLVRQICSLGRYQYNIFKNEIEFSFEKQQSFGSSIVEPDPNWVHIQELNGTGSVFKTRIRVHMINFRQVIMFKT